MQHPHPKKMWSGAEKAVQRLVQSAAELSHQCSAATALIQNVGPSNRV